MDDDSDKRDDKMCGAIQKLDFFLLSRFAPFCLVIILSSSSSLSRFTRGTKCRNGKGRFDERESEMESESERERDCEIVLERERESELE